MFYLQFKTILIIMISMALFINVRFCFSLRTQVVTRFVWSTMGNLWHLWYFCGYFCICLVSHLIPWTQDSFFFLQAFGFSFKRLGISSKVGGVCWFLCSCTGQIRSCHWSTPSCGDHLCTALCSIGCGKQTWYIWLVFEHVVAFCI